MGGSKRDFDILLWGITGWTGVHMLEHFVLTYPIDKVAEHGIRWAVVARNEAKMDKVLKQVADNFSAEWLHKVPKFIVDNNDESAVDNMVSKSLSVATAVGPYAKFGEPLVKSCVKHNTHYGDITGESFWVKKMIDKYHVDAEKNGTFIIPFCGCDCIPSDISAFQAIDFINKQSKEAIKDKKLVMRGYCSEMIHNNRHNTGPAGGGGTIASLFGIMEEAQKGAGRFNLLTSDDDPSIADKDHRVEIGVGRESRLPKTSWTTFFWLADGNEKVVRRSRYLMSSIYGNNLSFREKMAVSSPFMAVAQSAGSVLALLLLSYSFTKNLVARFLPQPSQTPNPRPAGDDYKAGSFEYVLFTDAEYKIGDKVHTSSLKTTFSAKDDIGWTITGIMLGESCLAMVKNGDKIRKESKLNGGILTTATMGNTLIERLVAHPLINLKTEDISSDSEN